MSNPPSFDPKEEYRKLGINVDTIDEQTEETIKRLGGEKFSVAVLPTEVPRRLRNRPILGNMVVPYLAERDKDGKPMLAVVNEKKRIEVANKRLCGVCGKGLNYVLWFIGGPRSLQTHMFVDPPMHYECAIYSLAMCPYLRHGGARFLRAVDEVVARGQKKARDGSTIASFDLVKEGRPALMGLVLASRYEFVYAQRSILDKPQAVFVAGQYEEISWYSADE